VKKIEAYVRKERFQEVDSNLKKAKVGGLTYIRGDGLGGTLGAELTPIRGDNRYEPEHSDRVKLAILVRDTEAQGAVEAIIRAASTGSAGDGKVFLTSVEQIYDIASRDSGEMAL